MVKFRVPEELVEECGRLIVWRRVRLDSESVQQGERFREEMVRRLGQALWDYIEGLDAAARVARGDVFTGVMEDAGVKKSKRQPGAEGPKRKSFSRER